MRERAGADRQVQHLDHAEHAGFGEDARERAGDRGRRLGMGERQPALQGDEPHLDGEAEEEADGDGCADGRRDLTGLGRERRELERTDRGVGQQDAELHHIGARRAHQEIDEAGAQRLGGPIVDDQEIRRPGHQLPEQVEIAELVRRGQADQRAGHQEGEEIVAVGRRRAADIAERIDDHQRRDSGEQEPEQSRGRVEACVESHDRDGGDRQQRRRGVARRLGDPPDSIEKEGADIGDEHRRGPRRVELRHAFRAREACEARGEFEQRRRPQAEDDRQRGERPGELHGERRGGRKRDVTVLGLDAHALDDEHIIDGGDDGRDRAGERHRPEPALDRGVEDDELGEGALERRQAHHREHAESEQGRGQRHAPAAAGKVVEFRRAGAADEAPACGEHEAAHHDLEAEVHQRAGVAGGAADAKADQHIAKLGDGRNHKHSGEIGQAHERRGLADDEDQSPDPGECRRRSDQRIGREMREHPGGPFLELAFRPLVGGVAL